MLLCADWSRSFRESLFEHFFVDLYWIQAHRSGRERQAPTFYCQVAAFAKICDSFHLFALKHRVFHVSSKVRLSGLGLGSVYESIIVDLGVRSAEKHILI